MKRANEGSVNPWLIMGIAGIIGTTMIGLGGGCERQAPPQAANTVNTIVVVLSQPGTGTTTGVISLPPTIGTTSTAPSEPTTSEEPVVEHRPDTVPSDVPEEAFDATATLRPLAATGN
jgi:hypothetical protein